MSSKLDRAIKAEGIEPCRRCASADFCAEGNACWSFYQWVTSSRIISDPFVWAQSRSERPDEWIPEKAIYWSVFLRKQSPPGWYTDVPILRHRFMQIKQMFLKKKKRKIKPKKIAALAVEQ